MQDRYAGDIGDYLKFGILRALSGDRHVGIAWWRFPNESHNEDGKYTAYLKDPETWARYDQKLFAALQKVVAGCRSIKALEAANLLPNASFFNEPYPAKEPWQNRSKARSDWFARARKTLAQSQILFVDPDNGLAPTSFKPTQAKAGKSITLCEVAALRQEGRCLIVYHHQTRKAGGHLQEIAWWAKRLRRCGFNTVDALRAKPWSPRVFFLLDATRQIREKAAALQSRWTGHISWHPHIADEAPAMDTEINRWNDARGIEMLGNVKRTVSLLTPEEEADNAKHDEVVKQARAIARADWPTE